jgi:phytoene dehydrogenase-like protein
MLDLVRERFVHEKVMIHLIKFAAELLVAPDEKGTGAILFNMPGFVHKYPSGVPIGGSAALVEALLRCLAARGADFRTEAEVRKVNVSGGRATGVTLASGEKIRAKKAVIGQIHPWLLGDMVEGLDARVVERAKATKTASFSIMAAHFALNAPPRFRGDDSAGNVALINFAPPRMEDMLRMFDAFCYGELGDHAIMAAHVNSQFDPSRAPAGKAAMGVFGFGPWELKDGGSAAWEARKRHYADWLLGHLRRHIVNLADSDIVAWKFCSPLDMVRDSPTFQRGDVGGVGKYFFQIGGHRPTPDLAQYAVPGADGLYLAGTFMHPPGGVTGGGRATAMRIAKDLKIDFDKLVK